MRVTEQGMHDLITCRKSESIQRILIYVPVGNVRIQKYMHPQGFTVPRIDSILVPYAKKSFAKYSSEYMEILKKEEYSSEDIKMMTDYARNKVQRDFEQGWQGIEMKLNSVGSSRGDYPFVTMTFGLDTTEFGKMASITFLNVHRKGQGKKGFEKPVLFPKLVNV